MDTQRTSSGTLETMAWGAFFIWWGITELVPSLPHGTGALGLGAIMLGLNAARAMNGLSTSSFTLTLGILLLVVGGLELAGTVLNLPFEIPVFAVVLLVLGVILLGRGLLRPGGAPQAG